MEKQMSDYKHIEQQIQNLRSEIVVDGLPLSRPDQKHLDAADTISAMLEVVRAAKALRDDMLLRADIGTHDGDHSVQAGNSVWSNICESLARLEDRE